MAKQQSAEPPEEVDWSVLCREHFVSFTLFLIHVYTLYILCFDIFYVLMHYTGTFNQTS